MNALLLARPEDFQNPKVSEVWAKFKGCPFSEASTTLRRAWGLLADNLSSDEAERFAAALKAAGIEVKTCSTETLVVPPPAEPVKSLALSTDALVMTANKKETLLPWNNLAALFSFALNESSTKTTKVTEGPSAGEKIVKMGITMATGIPLPIARKKTVIKKVTQSELLFFLDVIYTAPLRRYRIDGQHLDYAFLGPKKEMGSQGNFRLMFDDLRARLPHAFLNKGARILAAHQPVSGMGYETLYDVDRETKWFLNRE